MSHRTRIPSPLHFFSCSYFPTVSSCLRFLLYSSFLSYPPPSSCYFHACCTSYFAITFSKLNVAYPSPSVVRLFPKTASSNLLSSCHPHITTNPLIFHLQENFTVMSDSPVDTNHHYDPSAPRNPLLEKEISLGSSRLAEFKDNTTQVSYFLSG